MKKVLTKKEIEIYVYLLKKIKIKGGIYKKVKKDILSDLDISASLLNYYVNSYYLYEDLLKKDKK
ncbi:hypothetical protein [Campylobacter hominis]|uniref:Uncharacterized protein n=1 Tax=Campylobacter hominis (strain ATCC BAA-381 / DSM 21671 / CCUG 45161 / LMG 19568 / NCTC 13146 / CH001A) TaxID=360107 RepID=A7I3K6_CAMHC|nr:hypothetical protein [Campylobacter hominis]ABS50968.1 hypothetical protein CHAB381_1567 [Campylobacter hominis ATCC BAA-381]UAK85691.1 hypothetical protein K8O82_07580 [Campylobacter hominis]SUW85610.1 Uncharacterised protein [Campylobacter hominis]